MTKKILIFSLFFLIVSLAEIAFFNKTVALIVLFYFILLTLDLLRLQRAIFLGEKRNKWYFTSLAKILWDTIYESQRRQKIKGGYQDASYKGEMSCLPRILTKDLQNKGSKNDFYSELLHSAKRFLATSFICLVNKSNPEEVYSTFPVSTLMRNKLKSWVKEGGGNNLEGKWCTEDLSTVLTSKLGFLRGYGYYFAIYFTTHSFSKEGEKDEKDEKEKARGWVVLVGYESSVNFTGREKLQFECFKKMINQELDAWRKIEEIKGKSL
ncbi:MAG: hypothetical protein D6780_05005, partial [Candidatus Dadabacteria bacterium]